jgi:hypothetical protein
LARRTTGRRIRGGGAPAGGGGDPMAGGAGQGGKTEQGRVRHARRPGHAAI